MKPTSSNTSVKLINRPKCNFNFMRTAMMRNRLNGVDTDLVFLARHETIIQTHLLLCRRYRERGDMRMYPELPAVNCISSNT